VTRMERGFWAFAVCRSPGGWAINFGPFMFYFGTFNDDVTAQKLTNAYAEVYVVLEANPGDAYRNAIVWQAITAALHGAGVTKEHSHVDPE
jgi:hypothetical protein